MKYSGANENQSGKTSGMVAIFVGLVITIILVTFTLHKNGDSMNVLNGGGFGNADETYNYLSDDEIVTKKLIGQEMTFKDMKGELKYKINSITAYDNMYKLCGEGLKNDLDHPYFYGLDYNFGAYGYDENGLTTIPIKYPLYFDNNSGDLTCDFYMFVFEIEITNVNATSTLYSDPYLFNLSGLFYLVNRSGERPDYGELSYFGEDIFSEDKDGIKWRCRIDQGETKTIHLGFFVRNDGSEKPFNRMGLANEGHTSTYDDNNIFYWFDMSDIISDMKN